jgi:zinc transporter ZupT
VASLLHSIFDGWVLAAGGGSMNAEAGSALSLGVMIHKIPEAFAFGVILRAAISTKSSAMRWGILTQTATFAGAMLEILAAPYLGGHAIAVLLAVGGGMFLYLGGHAVHGEWKRRTAGEVRIS